ncbi:MATE family efflux transporter [Vibrio palustris]|uniref:Multidrug resistance protein NorM n=1 Tax=Vibrio palustris TaxID=1918946 RepID=A0A1R4B684_9VIBR|nr:MATE family efflux transporter [Vibrio palustris]SJL84430.1 Multidrug export protein MepA [Vibrio palustris]
MQQTQHTTSLARQLFQMTWPMMFGVLSLMSFQLVDSAFIGQLGVLPLATQGFTMPIQMIIIGLQVGLGIATTAVISKALGARQTRYAKQLGGLVVAMGSFGVAIFCLLIYWIRDPILALLSAPEDIGPIIDTYWIWWLASAWIGAVLYFLYSLCRANGNTMLPGTIMMVTSLLNLILDPLFIFTFDMGLNGAAFATCAAFGIGILIVAPKVSMRHWMLFDWHDIHIKNSIVDIVHIMGPAMLSQLLPPLSSMLATKLLASFGTEAVAAWAVGSRFEFFSIVGVLALTMSMPPMVGRLLGAKNTAEIRSLVSIAVKFIFIFQLIIAVVAWLFATPLANIMTSEPDVQHILNWHLTIVPFSLGLLGICMLMVSVSNALGKSYVALLISALRLFACFLPCLWLGAEWGGLHGVFWGAFAGNLLAGVIAYLLYDSALSKVEKRITSAPSTKSK